MQQKGQLNIQLLGVQIGTVILESNLTIFILSVLKCLISFEQIILLSGLYSEVKTRNIDYLYIKMFIIIIFVTKIKQIKCLKRDKYKLRYSLTTDYI